MGDGRWAMKIRPDHRRGRTGAADSAEMRARRDPGSPVGVHAAPSASAPVPDPSSPTVPALVADIEAALGALPLPASPPSLYDPIRYVLAGGGKRIRPVVLLLSAEAFGGAPARARALPAALAAEVFHNFTLVHDDIMDHADTRRGRPTVHARWGEAEAILAGDLMMGLAYELLGQTATDRPAEARALFHRMVTRLCEGQALDLAFERTPEVSVEAYLDMIDRKTGALLELCLELGGLLGGADDATCAALRQAGHLLGRAFQIQDDLLDLTADHADWGKTIGGDLVEGKKTFLLLRTLERAPEPDRAWFARALQGGLPPDDIPEAQRRMDAHGVLEEATAEVARYAREGVDALRVLPPGPAAATLVALAESLAARRT
jgi:geranylgeranyl diphosphate synthase type II